MTWPHDWIPPLSTDRDDMQKQVEKESSQSQGTRACVLTGRLLVVLVNPPPPFVSILMPKIGPTTNLLSATTLPPHSSVTHTLNLHFLSAVTFESRQQSTKSLSLSLSSQPPSATRPACAVTWGGIQYLGRARKKWPCMGWAGLGWVLWLYVE